MKKFNVKKLKGNWIKDPNDKDIQYKIRPFSLFNFIKIPSEDSVDMDKYSVDMDQVWSIFDYSLIDWKGMEDEDGLMKCNEENKRIVYDYDQEVVAFISEKTTELREDVTNNKTIKNSKTSHVGGTQKKEK